MTSASRPGGGPVFGYYRITTPAGIIAVEESTGALRAVVYRPGRDRSWAFNPTLAARLIFDDRYDDVAEPADRRAAEEWCRSTLNAELPTEDGLHEICEAGDAVRNSRRWEQSLVKRYGRTTTGLGESPEVPEGRETTFYAVYTGATADQPATLIAIEPWRWPEGMRAVSWEPAQRAWIFDPDRSRDFLQDPRTADLKEVLSREAAERFASALGTELPDDAKIHRICEAGLAGRRSRQEPTLPR